MDMNRHRQIADNRAKALERIKLRQQALKQSRNPTAAVSLQPPSLSTSEPPAKIAKPSLSPEQKALIEKNRQRALERKNSREGIKSGNLKDATKNITANSLDSVRITKDIIADNNTANNTIRERTRPSVLRSDYIEYDFSTMTDTFGGFLADTTSSDPRDPTKDKTLDEWKEGVQSKNFMDQAPPIDPANSPKCFECKTSIEIDPILLKAFGCRVCKTCKEKFPEKYSLLTKTECKEDYFLTDPELQDETLFRRIIKANPHSGTFSKMQLFMRYQIEEFAFKKWGSEEALDKEWLRREEMRIKRRDKRFNEGLKEMRKKLRAEEWTRKLKGNSGDRHVHDWSKPVDVPNGAPGLVKRRCMDCGMEIEEILM